MFDVDPLRKKWRGGGVVRMKKKERNKNGGAKKNERMRISVSKRKIKRVSKINWEGEVILKGRVSAKRRRRGRDMT